MGGEVFTLPRRLVIGGDQFWLDIEETDHALITLGTPLCAVNIVLSEEKALL